MGVLFLVSRLLVVSSQGGRGWGALWGIFHQGTDPVVEGFTLMTESPLLIPSSSGVRISTYEFWGEHKTFRP